VRRLHLGRALHLPYSHLPFAIFSTLNVPLYIPTVLGCTFRVTGMDRRRGAAGRDVMADSTALHVYTMNDAQMSMLYTCLRTYVVTAPAQHAHSTRATSNA